MNNNYKSENFNTLNLKIPYVYAEKWINLNWYDVKLFIDHGFFEISSAVEHAMIELEKDDVSQNVVELSILYYEEKLFPFAIHPYIDELAEATDDIDKKKSKDKLLYIVLRWVYDNRNSLEDPLLAVDCAYDDFGFPKSMEGFVRYLPTSNEASDRRGIDNIYHNWELFISEQENQWKP